jgi:hypothetical protein
MTTLLDVRNAVKRKLVLNDTVYDTDIDDCIRQVLRSRNQDKLWFLERVGTLTLELDSSSVSFPASYGDIERIDLIRSGQRSELANIPYKKLEARYYLEDPITSGVPEAYSKVNRTLYFSHTADQVYTLPTTYYIRDETLPTLDTDTSVWFGDDGFDLVRAQATYFMRVGPMEQESASLNEVTIATQILNEKHRQFRTY